MRLFSSGEARVAEEAVGEEEDCRDEATEQEGESEAMDEEEVEKEGRSEDAKSNGQTVAPCM
jgi:hypothetical protein